VAILGRPDEVVERHVQPLPDVPELALIGKCVGTPDSRLYRAMISAVIFS
jgi:hypothetical protein